MIRKVLDSETAIGSSHAALPYPQEAVAPPRELAHIRDEINASPVRRCWRMAGSPQSASGYRLMK